MSGVHFQIHRLEAKNKAFEEELTSCKKAYDESRVDVSRTARLTADQYQKKVYDAVYAEALTERKNCFQEC